MDIVKTLNKTRIYIFFLILLALVIASVFYFNKHANGQAVKHLNLKYGDNAKQSFDLYAPNVTSTAKMPVIIYVHGGGWSGGDKDNVAEKPSFFTNKGYVFVSVNHRLSPKATYEEMADDISLAVKWIYENADNYQLDNTKINLMGHSAGGHLVMLIGTNPKYLYKVGLSQDSLKSIVNLEGPLDLTDFIQRFGTYKKVFGNDQKVWAEASPITYAANKNLPPMFLVTRRKDSISTFVQTTTTAGNTAEFFECKTLSHSGVTKFLGADNSTEEAKNMTNEVVAFLNKNNR